MMRVHFIQHETFEAPGAFLAWAETRGYVISFSKVFADQTIPSSADYIDLLIVLGGPQSPSTTLQECPHFDSKAEIALIQQCIALEKAVVGVCLGAQLIAEALGANYESSPEKEIGVFPLQLTAAGLRDEKISHFGQSLAVGHWHNDMPGLTAGCEVLATTVGCPRQIIAYSSLVYGFQCHMEFTREVVELLIAEEEDFLVNNDTHRFVQKPDVIRNYDYAYMNDMLFQFLDKLAAEYRGSQ